MIKSFAALFLLLGLCMPAHAVEASLQEKIANIVDKRFGGFGNQEPGATVALVRGSDEIFRFETGLASLEQKMPLTGQSQMRIASLTKQFVAVAILQELESGSLELTAPITRYLPELAPAGDGVTIRHLLHHTSGLPHHSLVFMNEGLVPYDPGPPAGFLFAPMGTRPNEYMPTNEDVVSLLSKYPTSRFAPGTRWEYSNAGYILLVQVLEALHGTPFREIAKDRLFIPLGMHSTGVLDETQPALSHQTNSYQVSESGYEERDYSPFNLLHGDGGIYSTLDDLVRWRRAFEPGVLLTADSLQFLRTNGRLDNDTPITGTPRGNGYAMGWFTDQIDGTPILLHGGGWLNFRHAIYFAPSEQLWVVVLTNRSDTHPYGTAEEIIKAALKWIKEQ